MGLYKNEKDVKTSVDIIKEKGKIKLTFHCDAGKFGTDELLAQFEYTPEKLLSVLEWAEA